VRLHQKRSTQKSDRKSATIKARELQNTDAEKTGSCKQAVICYTSCTMAKYITSTADIMGGAPVIKGTRIPIEVILYRLKEGYPIEVIHDFYPWVDIKTLEEAIDEAIQLVNTTFHAEKIS